MDKTAHGEVEEALKADKEAGRRVHERFHFYIVALAFTILAAATQKAAFGKSFISDYYELVGWGTLLISGLMGLWVLKEMPEGYFGAKGFKAKHAITGGIQQWSLGAGIVFLVIARAWTPAVGLVRQIIDFVTTKG